MSRNEEMHFSSNPTALDIQRSKFNINYDHKTTMDTGYLYPIYCAEVLPGDTAKIELNSLIRMATPIYPVMDNCYMDTYFFSVPNRLLWEHWKEFMGENTTSYWTPEVEYTIPQTTAPEGGWEKGTIADHLGLPIGVSNISVSSLPFRAYSLIYNEWFRSENLCEPLNITKGDATTAGTNGTDEIVDAQCGGYPAKVGRLADYFSSALPEPQKGPDVYIPIGSSAPVIGTGTSLSFETNINGTTKYAGLAQNNGSAQIYPAFYNKDLTYVSNPGSPVSTSGGIQIGITRESGKSGMIADLSSAGSVTINQLRQAFAIQRMYEKDARGGTRYTELIRTHFNVISPDARQQRPEYLGGKRIPINITQVVQTNSTDSTSPQGNTAAYSLTVDSHDMLTKSFTEHGYIIGLACIRTDRTYQQGIERMWSRKNREDYYFPALANIGEMAIKNKEIYAQGTSEDDEVFGYQEAWADYRYKPNQITGELRSTYATPLDSWHYGDKYTSLPVLSKSWFEESKTNVARTLAIESQDQFICDLYFETVWTRPMPIYSIPGLIDHH